jgi:simple sugar transport system ATP-binding protein
VLKVERVSKRFGDVSALHEVSAEFAAGEIHAVLGENGAGKSTLMSVIAGFVVPDGGSASLEGRAVPFGRPHEVRAMGIELVHQHFMLIPEFTVAENFALGTLPSIKGLLVRRDVEARLREVAVELGWEVEPSASTKTLPVGIQQRLEIMKALAGSARVLILDEPTAVLSPDEVQDLFRVLRRLRDSGTCVVLIAHKLSEVLAIADRVTVLRRGERVASAPVAEVDERTLAEWMVGELPVLVTPLQPNESPPLLGVRDLHVRGDRGEPSVQGVTFALRPGEVLGIGGVDGNGQLELVEALVGLRPVVSGSLDWSKGRTRVGYVPQDRQGQGLALGMSLLENYLIGVRTGPWIDRRALRATAETLVREFDVRIGSLDDPASSLSGGNQQKLVVSRVLSSSPDLLVAHNPTRGLDVRATAFVQERMLNAARAGAAVLLVSADLDELASLSTRTVYIKRGRLAEGGAEAMVG